MWSVTKARLPVGFRLLGRQEAPGPGGDVPGSTNCGPTLRRTGPSRRARRWHAPVMVALFGVAAATAAAEQQLTLGSVVLKLGEPDAAVMEELSKQYKVQRIDGGWSIHPLHHSRTAPGIGVRTAEGRIQSVSFLWGPGFTPA